MRLQIILAGVLSFANIAPFASAEGRAPALPGKLGPLRYFESIDDASKIWMIDWNLDGEELALIRLSNHRNAIAEKVIAYKLMERTPDPRRFTLVAEHHASPLIFADEGGVVLDGGTVRKRWNLYGTSGDGGAPAPYVERPVPASGKGEDLVAA